MLQVVALFQLVSVQLGTAMLGHHMISLRQVVPFQMVTKLALRVVSAILLWTIPWTTAGLPRALEGRAVRAPLGEIRYPPFRGLRSDAGKPWTTVGLPWVLGVAVRAPLGEIRYPSSRGLGSDAVA